MAVIDLHSQGVPPCATALRSDICIVGSGPAGCTLARELSGTGLAVVLLESGGFERLENSDALDRVENVGRPRSEQWAVRNRIIGGSSHTWGGRCAPFDAIDFEERAWVPASGWPFPLDELAPYLERSAPYLGLAYGNNFSDERFWQLFGRTPIGPEPDRSKLLPFFWQFSRDEKEAYPFEYTRFGRHIVGQLGPNVTLVSGATVLRITTGEAGKAVDGIEWASPDGQRFTLATPVVALCAGGIENARILLASDQHSPAGLGNSYDLVGRYLMDHVRGPVGHFDPRRTASLQRRYGRYAANHHLFRSGLRLSPTVQRDQRLLNSAVWLGEVLAEDDPWVSLRQIARGKPHARDFLTLAANAGLLLRGSRDYVLYRNGFPRKLADLTLECMVEQRPDPDSRVTLSDQRDRLGMRLPRMDWRVHEDEARTMHVTAELVRAEFERIGVPVPVLAEWVLDKALVPADFLDVAHPTGTTRMADDPSKGVVDASGQVHGVYGLYVAGTSVFPTGGHCNPTQMIVAMALRLADTLKLRARQTASTASPATVLPAAATVTVLVTGATGRIGRILVEDLIERGYKIRATTSRTLTDAQMQSSAVEWRRFNFLDDTDYAGLTAGCDAILHLAAEIGQEDVMEQINSAATGLLAEAAEKSGVRTFCYVSTVAIYGSGLTRSMTEDTSGLTVEQDVPAEYWALDYVRTYGRTKLKGELAIRRAARNTSFVILRPTVVVDVADLIGLREWSLSKRLFAAHRHAHHVYVRDVTEAVIWSMEQGLTGAWTPGGVQTFNVAEDDFAEPRHIDFMRKAFRVSQDKRFQVVLLPGAADWLHDFLRFRRSPLRSPLWRMRFPTDRLHAAGYRHRYGMAHAHERALAMLRATETSVMDSLDVSGR